MKNTVKKNSVRDALLQVSADLFSQYGYESVSTRDIADAAKVNLGSIQYYFGSKAKLFMATIVRMMEGEGCVRNKFTTVDIQNKEEAISELLRFLKDFLSYMVLSEGTKPCRLLFREIIGGTTTDVELKELLTKTIADDFIKPVYDELSKILRVLKPDLDKEQRVLFINSIVGQTVYYATHQTLLEKIMNASFHDQKTFNSIFKHLANFALAGCGILQSEDYKIQEYLTKAG